MVSAGLDVDAFELKRMMRQQANEKAFEIQVMAQRNFESELKKESDKASKKLREEFEKKIDQKEIDQKILKSKKKNEANLKKMATRNDCMVLLKNMATSKLMSMYTAENPQY